MTGYNVPPCRAQEPNPLSVIADSRWHEMNQAYVQYCGILAGCCSIARGSAGNHLNQRTFYQHRRPTAEPSVQVQRLTLTDSTASPVLKFELRYLNRVVRVLGQSSASMGRARHWTTHFLINLGLSKLSVGR